MAHIRFTANLQRHLPCPEATVGGSTVREALGAAFATNPTLKGYVLDEHGALRKHMIVFIDGEQIADRVRLSDPVRPDSHIDVMQALSGG